MKIRITPVTRSWRPLLVALLATVASPLMPGLVGAPDLTILTDAPLSLPRLAPRAAELGHRSINRGAFEVPQLAPGLHAKKEWNRGIGYLAVRGDSTWTAPRNGKQGQVTFVSFTLNASIGTQVNACGARLSIEQSTRDPGYAAIRPVPANGEINHELPLLLYGGVRMAALHTFTVQIDRRTGTWAIWARDNLLARDIPLVATEKDDSSVSIVAGPRGAWLSGLVYSLENPLFEDANTNTVPDDFEQEALGRLLGNSGTIGEFNTLWRLWQAHSRTRKPSEFVQTGPLPDSFPEVCDPNGVTVHGMPDGIKAGRKFQP